MTANEDFYNQMEQAIKKKYFFNSERYYYLLGHLDCLFKGRDEELLKIMNKLN